jgi:hypothetical protein
MIMETRSLAPDTHGIIFRDGTLYRDGFLSRFWNVFKHVSCSLVGHRQDLKLGSATLALTCDRCGWTSPGWNWSDEPHAAEERC